VVDTDEQSLIVLRAVAGDDASFQELVLRHQARIRSLIRRSLGDDIADDIAQEVFLKAWRNLPRLRDARTFSGWLRRIAVHAIVDRVRARPDLKTPLTEAIIDTQASNVAPPEARLDLQAALARLTPGQRLCIVLIHGEGLTHQEAADESGLPIGTIKSHIARATPLLRRWLSPQDARS
jgi:RNA polymerase sigma-70 factor (ECF subfamily)